MQPTQKEFYILSTNQPYNEKELLQSVSEGDETAFARLFNEWYPLLSTLILRLTRSEILTEEIVQDVFLKVWMGREALVYVDRFKPFLWVMAKHLAIDALRKTAARHARESQYQSEFLRKSSADDEPDYHTLIDEAVARLPPQQQRVYLLSRRNRLKQAEIAKMMGISVATVKSYMQLSVHSITHYVKEKAGLGVAVIIILKIFS